MTKTLEKIRIQEIEIGCVNDAVQQDPMAVIRKLFDTICEQIENGYYQSKETSYEGDYYDERYVRDDNGNKVAFFRFDIYYDEGE